MSLLAEEGTQQYRRQLVADPGTFALVHRTITAHIRLCGWTEHINPAVLCVTELLANVRDHAGPRCDFVVRCTPTELLITVSDGSHTLPVVRRPDWDSESGRGMWLLSQTADDWGAEPTEEGKDVWFCFRRRSLQEPGEGTA